MEDKVTYEHQLPSELLHECPHCGHRCQFNKCSEAHHSESDQLTYVFYKCQPCKSVMVTRWTVTHYDNGDFDESFDSYEIDKTLSFPPISVYKQGVNLEHITSISTKVKKGVLEAIKCYNHGLHHASMVMSRRAIQQDLLDREVQGENLYEQIESMGISSNLKKLLQKVKNFGNYGAHSDFFLYDKEGKPIEDEPAWAKLSLDFLTHYFADQEAAYLADHAPKSQKELGEKS